MKNALRVLVVALTTLVFTAVSFAAEEKKASEKAMEKVPEKGMEKAEKKAEKAKTHRVTGEVTSVDAKAGTLTVKGKDKDVNLTADAKAKDALGKVKVGDMVKVTYTEKDGKAHASSITQTKGGEKKSEKGMEKSKAMDKPEKKADEKKADEKKAATK